jgi:hypothetical protein
VKVRKVRKRIIIESESNEKARVEKRCLDRNREGLERDMKKNNKGWLYNIFVFAYKFLYCLIK